MKPAPGAGWATEVDGPTSPAARAPTAAARRGGARGPPLPANGGHPSAARFTERRQPPSPRRS